MDIQKEYSCLERNDLIYHKQIDCDFDCQETLQQYSDDILRVIKCDSLSQITSIRVDSNGVEIDGKTEICITYYNDNNELCYADFDTDFNKKINISNLSDKAFVYVLPKNKYNNYRLVNQRRIDVHVSLILDVKVYDSTSCPCLSSCDNSKLKIEKIHSANIYSSSISKLEFDEEFSISSNSKPIKRIVSHNANVIVGESKIIKDKALIKLSVCVSALYTTDDNDDLIEKTEHTFDLSKIIDITGLNEDDIIITNADVSSMFVKAKNINASSLNEIEVYGDISITSVLIKKDDIDIITDGYLIGRKCGNKYNKMNCVSSYIHSCDTIHNSILFEYNVDFKEVYDISIKPVRAFYRNKSITITLCAKMLCKGLDGSVSYISAESDVLIDEEYDFNKVIASLCVSSFDYNIESNCQINAHISLSYNMFLYSEKNINVLCELDAFDDVIDSPAITLYFGKKNESIWEIAKQFSSDIELIEKENLISSNVLDNDRVLLIPGV